MVWGSSLILFGWRSKKGPLFGEPRVQIQNGLRVQALWFVVCGLWSMVYFIFKSHR